MAQGWQTFRHNPAALAGMLILAVIIGMALFAPLISPHAIDAVDWDSISIPPNMALKYYFGTDANGRTCSRGPLAGARVSLLVGISASLVSLVIGVAWGATAGYLGGRVDNVMMRVVDILYSLPFIFFVILLTVYAGAESVDDLHYHRRRHLARHGAYRPGADADFERTGIR